MNSAEKDQKIDLARNIIFIICLLLLLMPFKLYAEKSRNPIALQGATVYTAIGPPIQSGIILIENGKISAVGKNIKIPNGFRIIDASRKVITPGLVDIHSHMGMHTGDINESLQLIGPENRSIDSLNINDPAW